MSFDNEALSLEQRRVDWVVGLVCDCLNVLEAKTGQLRSTIVDIRKNFWDDVTVNFDEPDDVVETYAAVKQQVEVLSEKERAHRMAQQQVKLLLRLEQSPYFGRVDFKEAGTTEEAVYVGIGSFRDADDNFVIYDWRAPISSLYYDYAPGPAEYRTPGGIITGDMTLKRQFIIQSGQITGVFDTGLTIGDTLLQQMLGKQADAQMKSIVATIQREQNQIIRHEGRRVLMVQGAAGSGKTSAALQRIAYLLYRHRDTLTSDNILLFSPNPLFNSYISNVLPELGEENMRQTTFQSYLEHRLGSRYTVENVFEQLDAMLQADADDEYQSRVETIAWKASFAYMALIDQYVQDLAHHGMRFHPIKLRGKTLVSAAQVSEAFDATDEAWSIPNRMAKVVEWLTHELKRLARVERDQPWVEDEIELLGKEDYLRAFQKLRRQKMFTEESFNDFHQERAVLAGMVVKRRFKPLLEQAHNLRFVDLTGMYQELVSTRVKTALVDHLNLPPHRAQVLCDMTIERIGQGTLPYEDATPFLYLKQRIEGFQTQSSVRHVFVDEAQDYSPFQFALLKRLFPQTRLTILGDPNQLIYLHGGDQIEAFSPLYDLYGPDQVEMFQLRKSYRSTWEIIAFTRPMIAGGAGIDPFERHGAKPQVVAAASPSELQQNVIDQINQLVRQGHRTIAVICKTTIESQWAYDGLRDALPVRLINQDTTSYESGVLVIPAYLAKGVEFDAVIIYNGGGEAYSRPFERKLLYTACTRAMHALVINYLGELSPFIAAVPNDTYDHSQAAAAERR